MKKVVVTGPECSGKTTLAQQLSEALSVPFMEEIARSYLTDREGRYALEDIEQIARLHIEAESNYSGKSDLLILDTDLITLEIWAEEKFGTVPDIIADAVKSRQYDLYLLCMPEMPWVYDPLRENPSDRDRLMDIYLHKLEVWSRQFVIISGTPEQRLRLAMEYISHLVLRES
ncbi:MAG: ATP-binding protein [Saprospiraceae bacterium]|nr:ATP-binding protein [Saprospiraceae bacterium]